MGMYKNVQSEGVKPDDPVSTPMYIIPVLPDWNFGKIVHTNIKYVICMHFYFNFQHLYDHHSASITFTLKK